MKQLNASISPENLFSNISGYTRINLLLDYDGTLAPFRRDRDCAFPYPGISGILNRLILQDRVRVVIISGRPVDTIRKLLKLETYPEIWGCHGSERYTPGGEYHLQELPEGSEEKMDTAFRAVENAGFASFCEKKPTSIALHWRGVDPRTRDKIQSAASHYWKPLTGKNGLTIHRFDGGIELRFSDINKGNVIDNLIAETGDSELVLYLGDDYTDEDAFRALKGKGFSFLVRTEFRETEADFWIEPPGELIMILNDILKMCGD
ncbi:MAG: trehalose-phosphatase [Candidatus Latescibacteria bacterium]|nr:trehalose-phosphatase [Candidatus Latescibacterota bacterium]